MTKRRNDEMTKWPAVSDADAEADAEAAAEAVADAEAEAEAEADAAAEGFGLWGSEFEIYVSNVGMDLF